MEIKEIKLDLFFEKTLENSFPGGMNLKRIFVAPVEKGGRNAEMYTVCFEYKQRLFATNFYMKASQRLDAHRLVMKLKDEVHTYNELDKSHDVASQVDYAMTIAKRVNQMALSQIEVWNSKDLNRVVSRMAEDYIKEREKVEGGYTFDGLYEHCIDNIVKTCSKYRGA